MWTDDTIIARQSAAAGALAVLSQTRSIEWLDGSTVTLHLVQQQGRLAPTLRAVLRKGGHLQLIDLARLPRHGRRLDAELRTTAERDVDGLLFYTLRQVYPGATLFLAEVERHATGTWWPVHPAGYTWAPAARAVDPQVLASSAVAVLDAKPITKAPAQPRGPATWWGQVA